MRGMRAFTVVNDRLSRACPMNIVNALGTFLTTNRGERAFVKMPQLMCLACLVLLSGCADLSMYNQTPAPIGGSAPTEQVPSQRAPVTLKTFPLDSDTISDYRPQPEIQRRVQKPAVIALLDGAQQFSAQGQYSLAAAKMERAIRISPRDPLVWHHLAKIRIAQQQYELAISLAKKSNLLAAHDRMLQRNNWLIIAESFNYLGQTGSANKAQQQAARLL